MRQKKNLSYLRIFIPVLLVIILLFVFQGDKGELQVSQVSIFRDNDDYFLSFTVINNTENKIESKLEATVTYRRLTGKGGGIWDTAGRKGFVISLEPREKKEFQEQIDLTLPPQGVFQDFRYLQPYIQVLSISGNHG